MSLDARSKTDPEDSHSNGQKSSSSRSRSSGGPGHGHRSGGGGPRTVAGQAGGASVATAAEEAAAAAEQQVVPVFFLTIGVCQTAITYTPDVSAFNGALGSILSKLNDAIASTASLMQDRVFSPFSQPILYGKIESYRNTTLEEESLFTSDHATRCQDRISALKGSVAKAFQMCGDEMGPYTKTAFEFCKRRTSENGEEDSRVETDVEVLKATLARLQEQQTAIKSIPESRSISFFKADLRLFKRTVLPNITRAITKLQESLPKVGREKMDDFGEDAKALKELIEFEPKVRSRFSSFMFHRPLISFTSGRR